MTAVRRNILLAAAAVCALGAAPALSATKAGPKTAMASGEAPVPAADLASPKYGTWGFDASGEDRSVAPGTDFFRFANGIWWDKEVIPSDKVRFGNFDILNVLSESRTRLLIESAGAGHSADPDAAKVGTAYRAFMNQDLAEKLDAAPLKADLDAIRAERSHRAVAALMGKANGTFQGAIFDTDIQADEKAPTRYAVYMDTGGMGLPDRDYYLKPQFADKKAAYLVYVETQLRQIGWTDPKAAATAIVDFESKIADLGPNFDFVSMRAGNQPFVSDFRGFIFSDTMQVGEGRHWENSMNESCSTETRFTMT